MIKRRDVGKNHPWKNKFPEEREVI